MVQRYKTFYKAVTLDVGLVETVITSETRFPDKKSAEKFKKSQDRKSENRITVIIRID